MLYDNVRVLSVVERAKEVGFDGVAILRKIAVMPNVETFHAWKNVAKRENPALAYVISRLGGNCYRAIRDGIIKK
jgi:hypothetical protein